MRIRLTVLSAVAALCALAGPGLARAAAPMFVGAVENAPLTPDLPTAKAKMDLARLAGLDTLRLAAFWAPGRASVMPAWDKAALSNAATAAQLNGIRLVTSVSNLNSRTTPNTPRLQDEFSIYVLQVARLMPNVTDFIIGNEPNINTFWMPQYSKLQWKYVTKTKTVRVKGKLVKKKYKVKVLKKQPVDLAAIQYTALLAKTYDLLKDFNPTINVIGASLSPRGGDNPVAKRQTHSPTRFLLDVGAAYRKMHRTKPLMDTFSIHPYGEKSRTAPTFAHPLSGNIGLADYNKLVQTLGRAFKGTAQPGTTLPIIYDEYGVQTKIPSGKTGNYFNLRDPVAADAVSEYTQALYYKQALQMAYCQPNVMGMLFFHVSDERNGRTWQSGLYYADDTPKASLGPVRAAVASLRDGTLASCPGAAGSTALKTLSLPKKDQYMTNDSTWTDAKITCAKVCTYTAKVEKFPSGELVLEVQRDLQPDTETPLAFPATGLPVGEYRIVVRVWQYGKLGTTVVRFGTPFAVSEPTATPPAPPPPPTSPPPPPPPPALH
jgi:hypothetical protein